MIMLPVRMIFFAAAICFIQAMVGPSIGSASFPGSMLKPVLNISGSTMISVSPGMAEIFSPSCRRLADLSSQKREVWIRVMLSVDMCLEYEADKVTLPRRTLEEGGMGIPCRAVHDSTADPGPSCLFLARYGLPGQAHTL